jgi:hypothetical protein
MTWIKTKKTETKIQKGCGQRCEKYMEKIQKRDEQRYKKDMDEYSKKTHRNV